MPSMFKTTGSVHPSLTPSPLPPPCPALSFVPYISPHHYFQARNMLNGKKPRAPPLDYTLACCPGLRQIGATLPWSETKQGCAQRLVCLPLRVVNGSQTLFSFLRSFVLVLQETAVHLCACIPSSTTTTDIAGTRKK